MKATPFGLTLERPESSTPVIVGDFGFVFTPLFKSKAEKEWWEDAKVGDERWITIHPSEDSDNYRHVKVRLRPGGKWRIVAGGTNLEHQEIVPKHRLTDEERAEYDRRKAAREKARQERLAAQERLAEIRKQHEHAIAEAAGISTELPEEAKAEIERRADKLKLEGSQRSAFIEKQQAKAQQAHEKWVSQAVRSLVAQSRSVVFAEKPEEELRTIHQAHEEAEAQKRRLAERLFEARLAAAEKGEPAGLTEEAKPEKGLDRAKSEPEEEPVYRAQSMPVIAAVDMAQKLAALAKESEHKLREARRDLPKLAEDRISGTEALEQFTISAEAADPAAAERELLKEREDRLRSQLNSTLVSIADATYRADDTGYDRFGKKQFDVARAQVTGALDAITGISKHFLGSSFMDRPIVEALGIDGAAALAAGEIIRRRGKDEAARILAEIEAYQSEASHEIAETALSRHNELMEAKRTLQDMAKKPLVDDDGNLIAENLSETADCVALYGELTADALRHVGTALGSLQASASLMRLLSDAIEGGKKLDSLHIALRDPDDAMRIDRALRLHGRFRLEEVEGGTSAMVISPSALSRYLKEAKAEREVDEQVRSLQEGNQQVDVHKTPTGWRSEYVDEDGEKHKFVWKEGQARALQFAMLNSTPNGGGAVIDLEVGGGKTAFAFGYFGTLKERGWIGEGRRALYVAPRESLASQAIDDCHKFTTYTVDRIGGGSRSHEDEIRSRYAGKGFISVVTAQTLAADVKALYNMGIDPSKFFSELGYDAIDLDEAHTLVSGLSGAGATGRSVRKLRLKYNVAMTGTLATDAVSQPFDMVRWAVGNKVDSRAKILRKYGEVGQGTEAWQDAVNADVRAQIDRYTFHGSGNIEAKLHSVEHKVNLSHQQRAALRDADAADKKRRQQAMALARRKGRTSLDSVTKLKLADERNREVYEILHNRDWRTNPRLQEISRLIAGNPDKKFIIIGDTAQSLSGIHAVAQMLADQGLGDNSVLFASRTPDGRPISQKQMTRFQARFQMDPNCRFAVLAEPQAVGRNLQAADVVIYLDVPPNAASRKQRRGRAWRTGRRGDVTEIQLWTDQSSFDVARKLNVARTAGMLEAVSGK